MTRVEELENEIRNLDRAELAAFREWFQHYAADEWDRQIEEDAGSGKLDALSQTALRQHEGGKTTEL